jgi:hypothetical protein
LCAASTLYCKNKAGNNREVKMLRLSTIVRQIAITLVALVALATPSYSQPSPAKVRIEIVSGGFIIGAAGGRGTLTYQGKRYPLRIGGVSIGLVFGAAKAELVGQAYNLTRPSDISGTYTAVEAGYALAGGRRTARLKNSKGVILVLRGRQIGLEVSLDLSGMQVSLR